MRNAQKGKNQPWINCLAKVFKGEKCAVIFLTSFNQELSLSVYLLSSAGNVCKIIVTQHPLT